MLFVRNASNRVPDRDVPAARAYGLRPKLNRRECPRPGLPGLLRSWRPVARAISHSSSASI